MTEITAAVESQTKTVPPRGKRGGERGCSAWPRSRFGKHVLWLLIVIFLPIEGPLYSASVHQSKRKIPIVAEVDLVIAGGTLGGVAAAVSAAEAGRKVLLVAQEPYLGEDLCSTFRLWAETSENEEAPLTGRIFKDRPVTTPIRVKKVLEEALLDAGVQFVLGSYVTDLVRNDSDELAGVVLANRAGRQAVLARVVVDATRMAWIARMANAQKRTRTNNRVLVHRAVVEKSSARDDVNFRPIPCPANEEFARFRCLDYEAPFPLRSIDYLSLARLEQEMRERTYQGGQVLASDQIFLLSPDCIVGRKRSENPVEAGPFEIGQFMPEGIEHLFVLSATADLDSTEAAAFVRPDLSEAVGRVVGREAASQAESASRPVLGIVKGKTSVPMTEGDIREVLSGLRPTSTPSRTLLSEATGVPVLAEYDVVVIGGGTTGACAAIGAGRQGARVLVVEYQHGLGGTGTIGLIGKPYHGKSMGFSREVPFPGEDFTIEDKMEWFRREIRGVGGDIWFGVLGCGAFVEGRQVKGAVVATPEGRGVVLASVIVDATGNADVAVAAGSSFMYGNDERDIAMQGAGLPPRFPGSRYVNTDYLLVDESDMVDVWRALVGVRKALPMTVYDVGTLIQTRERRRIVGDHILSYLDQIAERTYADSIVFSGSDYDSHGYPSHPFFALLPHDESSRAANHPAPGGSCFTPYRCLLPRGLDGILVTGLGISMHRDASAMVRMQRDLHNQGYAAGVAAAMSVQEGRVPRQINVKMLQKHLVGVGSLPKEVLNHSDSFPLSQTEIKRAVAQFPKASNPNEAALSLAVILTHSEQSLPLLRRAHAEASAKDRSSYARVLGFLGDQNVVPELAAELEAIEYWDQRILQGSMAEYAHLPTPVDTLILALGYTGNQRALPALLSKLATLDATVPLSHHRAVALALEKIGSPDASEPLARLLAKPDMSGHVMNELEPLHDTPVDRRRRLGSLREITLARALYRCGDYQGLGEKILRSYKEDFRGLFARHASAVLGASSPALSQH